jgi:hypothetical protein
MPEGLKPVPVTVIDVGPVKQLEPGMVSTTGAQPNLLVNVISPIVAIVVRFVHTYLTTLVGLVTAGMATDVLPAQEFGDLLKVCAQLSLAGAVIGAIKDAITILGKLEGKWPLISGGV